MGPEFPQGKEIRQLKLVISTQESDIAEASKRLHDLQQKDRLGACRELTEEEQQLELEFDSTE